jgi:type IX secretion system PorP/SprF family membrane protein
MNYRIKHIACWLCVLLLSVFTSFIAFSQQYDYNNQFLINKFSLSPAYAGSNYDFEAFLGYKKNWAGISGAPETKNINVNGAIKDNMGLGFSANSQQAGIFRNFNTSLAYSYSLKISDNQNIRFGISAGISENIIEPSSVKSEINDPMVESIRGISGVSADAGAGVSYNFGKLNIGIAIPHLLEQNLKSESPVYSVYTSKRHFLTNISYKHNINKDFSVEPILIVRNTGASPVFYEFAALAKYKKGYWAGLIYRKNGSIGINIGASVISRVVAGYTYELNNKGFAAGTGTHEISIGFLIGKLKSVSSSNSESVFESKPQQPYMEWLNQ